MELTLEQITESNLRKSEIIYSAINVMYDNICDYIKSKFGNRKIIFTNGAEFNVTDDEVTLNSEGFYSSTCNYLYVNSIYFLDDKLIIKSMEFDNVDEMDYESSFDTLELKMHFIDFLTGVFNSNKQNIETISI